MTHSTRFEAAVGFVLRQEGGYVNDLQDPGGETNMGISRRAYPDLDIAGLTREQAVALYHRDYWGSVRGDDLPPTLAPLAFDAAVNQGVGTAIRLLQEVLAVPADGILGPATLAAAAAANPDDLALRYAARRAVRYGRTQGFNRFGLGWMHRLLDCYRFALVACDDA